MSVLRLLGTLLGLCVVLFLGLAVQDSIRWEKYAREHHCRVIHTDIVWMPTMVGKTVMFTPYERHTYLCDTGVVKR